MNALEILTSVTGWCLLINLVMLVLSSVLIILCRKWAAGIHGRMFGLDEEVLSKAYFDYLAHYKILVLVLNLAPYIALRIVLAGIQ